jgi:thioredoxin-related protein
MRYVLFGLRGLIFSIIALGFSSAFAVSPVVPVAEVPKQLEPSSREWERILPVAQNFKADGEAAASARKPILIFFNLTGCHYCRGALREVIVPMFRNAEWRAAMEFRQVTVDDGKTLVDFDGKMIENIAFAQKRKGTFTPTVMLVDGSGTLLGEPLVGVANFDFYGAYVEGLAKAAIEEMRARK